MCKVIEEMRRESEAIGEENALLASVRNLMANLSMAAESAMDALSIPVERRAGLAAQL